MVATAAAAAALTGHSCGGCLYLCVCVPHSNRFVIIVYASLALSVSVSGKQKRYKCKEEAKKKQQQLATANETQIGDGKARGAYDFFLFKTIHNWYSVAYTIDRNADVIKPR